MKLTKATLKRLIKEELGRVMEMEEEELEDGPFIVYVPDDEAEDDMTFEAEYFFFDSEGKKQVGELSSMREYAYDMATAERIASGKSNVAIYDLGAGHEVDGGIVDSDGNPISAADMAARF